MSDATPCVVWRFPLPSARPGAAPVELAMPRNAVPLSVSVRSDSLHLWAACDPGEPIITRRFLIVATGQRFDVPSDHCVRFIGTAQMGTDGQYVEHVWELAPEDGPERWHGYAPEMPR